MMNSNCTAKPTDPLRQLVWHYEHSMAESKASAAAGLPVVGMTSNTVPWEMIQAAGAFPCIIKSGNADHPDISNYMEEDVFEKRIRAIFGAAISGDLQHLSLLVISRTSEQEYKLYLYLREVVRQNPEMKIPPVYLYDLLHTRSPESYAYGMERTLRLKERLENLTSKTMGADSLLHAIDVSNSVCRATQKLLGLRRVEPRISGTEALALVGSSFFIHRDEYVRLAEQSVNMIERRNPLAGKRLLIQGASPGHRGLHEALEKHGAIVVAEDDWWGSRSSGKEIANGSKDPLRSIFEKYYFDTPSPRLFPFEIADEWFKRASVDGIDGVIFYFPPEDCVAGWDYPRHRRYLDGRGIPHLVIRDDALSISGECHERIDSFVNSLGVGR